MRSGAVMSFGDISESTRPRSSTTKAIRQLMTLRQVVLDIDAGAPQLSASSRFHPEKRFGSAYANPDCLLPQSNPHGKQRLWFGAWILRIDSYSRRGYVLTKWTEESDYKNRSIPLIQSAGVTPRCCQLIDISDAAIAK